MPPRWCSKFTKEAASGEAAMLRMPDGVRLALLVLGVSLGSGPSLAQSGLDHVNHIIIVMQENHSFDNYFGALPYAPGGACHRVELELNLPLLPATTA
jgi:phospholipase C